jgi:NDP-sugar pyrophosphorylase family protein
MAEINGRPFLDILIDYVADFGFRRFILCIGYMSDFIRRYYQGREGPSEIIFSEEKEPLGTAGAIKNAESLIGSSPFLVMNGDSFCRLDLDGFINFHKRQKALITVALANALEGRDDYGKVVLNDSGQVISFEERGKSKCSDHLVNGGVYLLEKAVFVEIPHNINFSLEHNLFPKMVNKGFYGYRTGETFIDIGTPERYKEANKTFQFKYNFS